MQATFQHVGLNVADVDRSLAFYGRLGFAVRREPRAVEGPLIESMLGGPGLRLRIAFAELDGTSLELVQYVEPPAKRTTLTPRDIGAAHIAVGVDDLRSIYDELSAGGVRFVGEPVMQETGPNAGSVVVFGSDPDGNLFQLVQRPS